MTRCGGEQRAKQGTKRNIEFHGGCVCSCLTLGTKCDTRLLFPKLPLSIQVLKLSDTGVEVDCLQKAPIKCISVLRSNID